VTRGGFKAGKGRGDELVISVHEPGRYVLGSWRNVLLFYWQVAGTPHAVALLEQAIIELHGEHSAGLSMVHLIKEGAGLPDPEVRKALLTSLGRHAEAIGCISVVMMGAGFWASALQSAITGLRMLAPPRSSLLRFSREPADLKAWLPHEHLVRTGQRLDDVRLLAVINELLALGNSAAKAATIAAH
jgi:hypothetical protein